MDYKIPERDEEVAFQLARIADSKDEELKVLRSIEDNTYRLLLKISETMSKMEKDIGSIEYTLDKMAN